MEGIRKRGWSDLPPDILSMILTRLHTRMDVLRLRSVCPSFRSTIPLPRRDAPLFPFPIPRSPGSGFFLHESTVYTVDKPADGAASGRERRWLLKLEESELGDMGIRFRRPHMFPEVLDSLQFRVNEICKGYMITGGPVGARGQKAVVHPDCVRTDLRQCVFYFIDRHHQLCYWKYGDEKWSHLRRGYQDVAVYQGKVCVVHKSGVVSWIDSSFKRQTFSLSIDDGRGHRKRLVVSSGDLYVVNMCFIRTDETSRRPDFRVYRLDQQRGRWEEVRSLGNSAFFLCKSCSFAVPAREELDWYKGDCIYYEEGDSYKGMQFNLADRRHEYPDFHGVDRRHGYPDWTYRVYAFVERRN